MLNKSESVSRELYAKALDIIKTAAEIGRERVYFE